MAAGEEVLFFGEGVYRKDDFRPQACYLVLSPSQLIYSYGQQPFRHNSEQLVSSIPLENITEMSYEAGSVLNWWWIGPWLANTVVIRVSEGGSFLFNVTDARSLFERLEKLVLVQS
jgi:hypothetical protein